MNKFYFLSGLLLAACASHRDLASPLLGNNHVAPLQEITQSSASMDSFPAQNIQSITSHTDSTSWKIYANPTLGFAFDYPEYVWNETTPHDKNTYTEDVVLTSINDNQFLRNRIGSLLPLQSTVVVLGVRDTGPEFVMYSDYVADEASVPTIIRERFGSTCRVSLRPMDSDISNVMIQWGEGENLMSRKCMIPNVAERIIFSKVEKKMLSLFMGQEIRFPSKTKPEDTNLMGYDGLISRSLRFVGDYE